MTTEWSLIHQLLLAAAGVIVLAQGLAIWQTIRVTRDLRRHDERLDTLAEAIRLLTEATESGFQSVAREVERLGAAKEERPRRTAKVARLTAAARRGQPVAEIAAQEGLSEGEVALHLHLARAAAATKDRVGKKRATKATANGDAGRAG